MIVFQMSLLPLSTHYGIVNIVMIIHYHNGIIIISHISSIENKYREPMMSEHFLQFLY